MKAIELIGKLAIRTKPTLDGDRSYMATPLRIWFADSTFIQATREGGVLKGHDVLLDSNFCDDGWRDYGDILRQIEENKQIFIKFEQIERGLKTSKKESD